MMEWIQRAVIAIFCVLSMHPAWAAVRSLDLHDLQAPLSVKNGDELLIPLAIPAHQFQVIWVMGSFVSARVWLENNNGEVIQNIRSRDLYLRQRVLLTHENCNPCKLRVSVWTERADLASLQVQTKNFSSKKTIRFLAEQQLQKALSTIENPEENKHTDLWAEINLSVQLWTSLRDEKEILNSLYFLASATEGYRPKSNLVLFPLYPNALSSGGNKDSLSSPLELLFSDYQYNPMMETMVAKEAYSSFSVFKRLRYLSLKKMDVSSLARINIGLGREEFINGNYERAEQYYNIAKSLIITLPKNGHKFHYLNASVYHQLGLLESKLENYVTAENELNNAFSSFSQISDASSMASVLNSQGFMNRLQNKLSLAAALHQVAFQLSQYGVDDGGLDMRTLYYLGVINALRGRYFTATESLNKAAVIASQYDVVHWYAHIVAALARINLEMGRFPEAESLYAKALESYKSVGDQTELSTVYINLGVLFARKGEGELAELYLRLVRESAERLTDQQKLNLQQAEISALMAKGDYSDAYNTQLMLINQPSKDKFFKERNLSRLAEIAIKRGDFDSGLRHALSAVDVNADERDELNFIKSSYLAALSSYRLSKPSANVLVLLDRALESVETIRASILRNDMRREFFSLQRDLYDLKVQVYLESSEPDAPLKALLAAESFRGRTLYETFLQQNQRKPLESYAQLSVEQLLRKVLQETDMPLDKATSIFQTGYFPELPRKAPSQLVDEQAFHNYQSQLKESEATLYYAFNQEVVYVWIIQRNHLAVHKIDFGDEHANLLGQVVTDLSHPPRLGAPLKSTSDEYQRRLALSKVLLGAVVDLLSNVNELTIVSDGLLHQLPFVALVNPSNEKLLLNTHSIASSLSFTTDSWLRQVHLSANQSGAILVAGNSLQSFDRVELPFVQKEVKTVSSIWSERAHRRVSALIDLDATKKNLAVLQAMDYEIVHFAGHAKVDWDFPGRTALFLASDKDDDSARLMVDEIIRWQLNAELVVLSACETAQGKLVDGEGSMGLSRAFFEAGARRVIASLWRVEDASSAYMVEQFYQSLLQNSNRPLNAFQAAQRAVSRIPRWSHPYYWSGMAYFGNREAWRE